LGIRQKAKGKGKRQMSILRRMKRQAGFARKKIETATAWAGYVEAERRAGRAPMAKRTWRAKRSDVQALRD